MDNVAFRGRTIGKFIAALVASSDGVRAIRRTLYHAITVSLFLNSMIFVLSGLSFIINSAIEGHRVLDSIIFYAKYKALFVLIAFLSISALLIIASILMAGLVWWDRDTNKKSDITINKKDRPRIVLVLEKLMIVPHRIRKGGLLVHWFGGLHIGTGAKLAHMSQMKITCMLLRDCDEMLRNGIGCRKRVYACTHHGEIIEMKGFKPIIFGLRYFSFLPFIIITEMSLIAIMAIGFRRNGDIKQYDRVGLYYIDLDASKKANAG